MPVPLAHALGKSLGAALVRKWFQERTREDPESEDSASDDFSF